MVAHCKGALFANHLGLVHSHGLCRGFLSRGFVRLFFCSITPTAPVYACLPPKVLDDPLTLRCRIRFLPYRCNKLRGDAEGHLNAPFEESEHPSPLSGSLN
jgi:hypothetical protein